ncbi:hypothetical protein [Litoreibacter janthinus]|uniref:Uncharacterized protein n=1 Tax=Litoreibacter janthinus TaxID=670154 RepID=A0A1I6GUT3_9RHOB|nr:hypothetical protein [Litoreibacter janthinus]SFR45886.1 hypothetical protein SAMN04488002_2006 [Litoreibacter janthinus]
MNILVALTMIAAAGAAAADVRTVFLETNDGQRIQIATLDQREGGAYSVHMNDAAFSDHFLSMRPFKCLEGPDKNWCHVPYPYEIERDISGDLVDMEYDFLFVWKAANDYGINMWNGVYYKIEAQGSRFVGVLHEMDMDLLSAPPAAGELRPLSPKDIHPSDADSHWLPRLIVE